ncbi:MATE family efflux transporter DinF [Gallaecimonas mangrovi]|uniref:MATE family efflux transporter DinF n=1 Tax=Gallaecimonas mangrovi TaxID=2291597 RepID=UPI0021F7A9DF|nr:MATE family efflux transporter DinF [Gallaecimonas mangrovi]
MILSNVTVPLLGLVDTAVIGHLANPAFLGGVAVGNTLITFLVWLCGFLRMATTGLIAQAHGKGDAELLSGWLVKAATSALILAAVMVVAQWPIGKVGLWLSGASAQVSEQAAHYFYARIWGVPAALLNLVVLGFLVGRQDTHGPMVLLILSNSLNIVLDLWFVVGLGWQVKGAAWASVLSDYSALALGVLLVSRRLPRLDWRAALSHSGWRRLLNLNKDILLRTFCLQLCFLFITFQGARLGDAIVAANAVLLNFLLLISYALDGIAYAAEALTGRAVGQKDEKALRYWVKLCALWSFGFAVVFTLFFGLLGHWLIGLLTDLPSIREVAGHYLGWVVVLPLVALWCYLFDGVFVGATRGRDMRNSMIVSTFLVFFPVWFVSQGLGNHALWLALTAFMAMRGLSLWYLYRKPGFVNGPGID